MEDGGGWKVEGSEVVEVVEGGKGGGERVESEGVEGGESCQSGVDGPAPLAAAAACS